MSNRQEEISSSCDLKRLKDFVADQKNLMIIVEKENCKRCERLEHGALPRFLAGQGGQVALAQIRFKENDQECNVMANELNLTGKLLPAFITYKGGVELERAEPTGDVDVDVQRMNEMAAKIK